MRKKEKMRWKKGTKRRKRIKMTVGRGGMDEGTK